MTQLELFNPIDLQPLESVRDRSKRVHERLVKLLEQRWQEFPTSARDLSQYLMHRDSEIITATFGHNTRVLKLQLGLTKGQSLRAHIPDDWLEGLATFESDLCELLQSDRTLDPKLAIKQLKTSLG
jgi:hypothetical protein